MARIAGVIGIVGYSNQPAQVCNGDPCGARDDAVELAARRECSSGDHLTRAGLRA
jgi:hypothetical protein